MHLQTQPAFVLTYWSATYPQQARTFQQVLENCSTPVQWNVNIQASQYNNNNPWKQSPHCSDYQHHGEVVQLNFNIQ